jgi:hypothetical protein
VTISNPQGSGLDCHITVETTEAERAKLTPEFALRFNEDCHPIDLTTRADRKR